MFRQIILFLATAVLARGSYLTGSGFPWENCKQDITMSIYSAYLSDYYLDTKGWTMCFRLQVLDQANCHKQQEDNYPDTTRCCDTGINKLKLFPDPKCSGSIRRITLNGISSSKYYWVETPAPAKHLYFKITPLNLTMETAKNFTICTTLQPPCATMEEFSYDKQVVEFALYDKKKDNYECCPVGIADVEPSIADPSTPVGSKPPPIWKQMYSPPAQQASPPTYTRHTAVLRPQQ